MKLNKKSIMMSFLAGGLVLGIATPNIIKANEMEEMKIEDVEETIIDETLEDNQIVETELRTSDKVASFAVSDSAFPESSKPLHDAILSEYPAIDTDADGSISQGEASSWSGRVISLGGKGITGTLDGIEHFTGVMYLSLGTNQLSGAIPSKIGNMSSLVELTLNNNNLSGEIPDSLSNLSALQNLQLYNNNLTGSLPNFTNAVALKSLSVNNNNLSGEVPNGIYSLPNLEQLNLHNNPNLTGDITSGFALNSKMVFLAVFHTSTTQEKPSVTNSSFVFLFDPLNHNQSDLGEGIDQDAIDMLKEEIEKYIALHNPQPGSAHGELLEQIETEVDIAEKLIVLNPKVEGLFDENGKVKDEVKQEDINDIQDLIEELVEGPAKDRLQEKLNEAQKQLEERDFVVLEHFKTFTGTGTVHTTIDAPIEKFNAVYIDGALLSPDYYTVSSGSTVVTLNETYLKTLTNNTYDVEIEFLSGAKIKSPLTVNVTPNASTDNPSTKPSVTGGDTVDKVAVSTGDTSNLFTSYTMLGVSLLGLVLVVNKKKAKNN
ncbi:MAG: toxin Cry1Ac domain D-VI-related protein [Coprobacillaceae bacterium]